MSLFSISLKKLAMSAVLLAATATTMAAPAAGGDAGTQQQQPHLDVVAPTHVLYLEWGAASNGLGIGYERRLLSDHQLYLRTGLGFGYSSSDSWTVVADPGTQSGTTAGGQLVEYKLKNYSYCVPVGVTYLVGRHRSKLETGMGISVLYEHETLKADGGMQSASDNSWSANAFANVGWRWQARSGFLFRVGLSAVCALNKNTYWNDGVTFGDADDRVAVAPYVGFGWSF